MNSHFSIFCILFLGLMMASTAAAAEIRLDGTQLIVMGVDDDFGLGAVDVVLEYGSDVSVTSVTALNGFMTVENIRNGDGMTVIAAISTEGRTGDVPVATVLTEGNGAVTVTVRHLTNVWGDPIEYTNQDFSGTIPSAGSATPATTTAPAATQSPTVIQTAAPLEAAAPITPEQDPAQGETPVLTTATPSTAGVEPVASVTIGTAATVAIPAGQNTPAKTPLSFFVTVLALGFVCVAYRMIDKR